MKIVCISDTHGKHKQVELPDGDILIHAGDISGRGEIWQVESFLQWFSARPHTHKVLIAGNHDFLAERNSVLFRELVPDNVIYLNDSGTEIEAIKIWGSPVSPWFYDWAFNRRRGEEIKRHWDLIPEDTNILITHGPAYGIQDLTFDGQMVGCEELNKRIFDIRPKLHVCGHIHEAYGMTEIDGITFINASILNLEYQVAHAPVVIDWESMLG